MMFENINKGIEEYRNTADAILLDVREPDEFAKGHIPGAVNLPLSQIQSCSYSASAPIFVYCHSGARSMKAAGVLKNMGFENVKNIGGIMRYKGEIEKE